MDIAQTLKQPGIAPKLVLGGIGGAAMMYFAAQGMFPSNIDRMTPEQREAFEEQRATVLLYGGLLALSWGAVKFFDISEKLQFLIDAQKPSPNSWEEFSAAMREQAAKMGIPVGQSRG
jgi:hypothetical protein